MAHEIRPALSVIVRRFRPEYSNDIENSIRSIQLEAAKQAGFISLQNSITPKLDGHELVTIMSFDTQEHLDQWENSPVRGDFVAELDRLSLDGATCTQIGDLTQLVHPTARISKAETVVILIAWILTLGAALRPLVDLLLPQAVGPFWRSALMTTIIVVLISYVLLPYSSIALTWLKQRLGVRRP